VVRLTTESLLLHIHARCYAPYISFFSQPSAAHRDLHSFPTRRSSDLDRSSLHADPFSPIEQLLDFHRSRDVIGQGWLERWKSRRDRKSTRLNSSHLGISYAVFCLKKKKKKKQTYNRK